MLKVNDVYIFEYADMPVTGDLDYCWRYFLGYGLSKRKTQSGFPAILPMFLEFFDDTVFVGTERRWELLC